jgi:uncharacterized protein (DUF2141 family)
MPGLAIMKYSHVVALLLCAATFVASIVVFSAGHVPVNAEAPGPLAAESQLPRSPGPANEDQLLHESVTGGINQERIISPAEKGIGSILRTVSIHVSGLKCQPSTLHVAVFDSAEGFPSPGRSRTTRTIPTSSAAVDLSLSLAEMSANGVAVFQDLNGDGKLTKNFFGIPVEPYGFSNNARSQYGPPPFSEVAFIVSDESLSIEISLR